MKILVIEDEKQVSSFIDRALRESGYETKVLGSAEGGLEIVAAWQPNLILLDEMMPGKSGFEFLTELRRVSGVPVMLLTAKSEVESRIKGLDLGADDYLPKPFKLGELLARIRAILRRKTSNQEDLELGDILLDFRGRRVLRNGRNLFLSPTEFSLFEYLVRNQGRTVSKQELLNHVWDDGERDPNLVEVNIFYLRNKLERGKAARVVQTVRGEGYVFKYLNSEWQPN